MAFTTVTKPSVGDCIKKSLIDAMIDNDIDLNARLSGITSFAPANGSFEDDFDADGVPDNWTESLSNTTLTLDDGSNSEPTPGHGTQHVYFTFSATTGTGTITSDEYTPCSYGQRVEVSWMVYGSQASLPARVRILWYDLDQASAGSSTLWDVTTLPTTWTRRHASAVAPVSARYFRIEIRAGDGSGGAVGHTVHFDGIDARLFHGRILIDIDSPTTIEYQASIQSEVTVTVGPLSNGENPVAVWIAWTIVGGVGDSGNFIIYDGDGNKVFLQAWSEGSQSQGTGDNEANDRWFVPLQAGQFSYEITADPAEVTLYMYGYEV